jgi:hypothetical protein
VAPALTTLLAARLQVAAQQERERQWRVARGEEPAGPGPMAGPAQRETWMTELPPERRPGTGPPSQHSQTTFSRQGIKGRGDTCEWTDTPEARAARLMQVGATAVLVPVCVWLCDDGWCVGYVHGRVSAAMHQRQTTTL